MSRLVHEDGFDVRRADVAPPTDDDRQDLEFVRCDTRTATDVLDALAGCDAVVQLAAWHPAHVPSVSDETIFAVNVDGTFIVVQVCRAQNVSAVVFASSMAYGWGGVSGRGVYGVTKVIGEDLWPMYHEVTDASVAMLRYHDFVPKPYLAWGQSCCATGSPAAMWHRRRSRLCVLALITRSNSSAPSFTAPTACRRRCPRTSSDTVVPGVRVRCRGQVAARHLRACLAQGGAIACSFRGCAFTRLAAPLRVHRVLARSAAARRSGRGRQLVVGTRADARLSVWPAMSRCGAHDPDTGPDRRAMYLSRAPRLQALSGFVGSVEYVRDPPAHERERLIPTGEVSLVVTLVDDGFSFFDSGEHHAAGACLVGDLGSAHRCSPRGHNTA